MDRKTLVLKAKKDHSSLKADSDSSSQSDDSAHKKKYYRCRQCRVVIARTSDEIQVGDIPTLTAQVNPHGFVHEVLTVSKAINYILEGDPIPADSWFPGFYWRICFCIDCLAHLGWSYHRPSEEVATFFGLRRSAIVEEKES